MGVRGIGGRVAVRVVGHRRAVGWGHGSVRGLLHHGLQALEALARHVGAGRGHAHDVVGGGRWCRGRGEGGLD